MTQISKEYAAALFQLAGETGEEETFLHALEFLRDTLDATPEYVALLSSPAIPVRERRDLLKAAFAENLPEYVLSCAELLCEHGHLADLPACVAEFEGLYHAFCAILPARIVSAVELTEQEKTTLVKKLEETSGHTVLPQYELDPELLGGMIVYLDDRVIDGSLRRKLKEVKEELGK